jgi:hypothetical protein
LEGRTDGTSISVTTNGTATITVSAEDAAFVDVIKEGDQVKLVDADETAQDSSSLDLVTPHYLAISKSVGGSDIVLDRAVVDSNGDALSGTIGVFRDTLRLFSHRILKTPFKKSSDFEIVVRWSVIMN